MIFEWYGLFRVSATVTPTVMDEHSKPFMGIGNRMDECEGSFEIRGVCWLNFQPTYFVQLTVSLVILLCTKPPPIALVAACLDHNLDFLHLFFSSAFVGLFLNLP